jgi:hypothetical protein
MDINNLRNEVIQLLKWYQSSTNAFTECFKTIDMTDEIFKFYEYHRIDMLLLDYYDENRHDNNDKFYQALSAKKKKIIFENEIYLDIISEIIHEFQKKHIKFVLVKGLPLMLYIYKERHHRYFADIDILTDKSQINEIERILKNMGYVYGNIINNMIIPASRENIIFQRMFTHELHNMVKFINEIPCNIDVNFKFSWDGVIINKMLDVPILELTTKAILFEYNNTIFFMLNDTYNFIHLCCHLFNEAVFFALNKDFINSDPRELLLFRLFDIVLVSKKCNDVGHLYKICEKYNCIQKVKYALLVIANILGVNCLREFNNVFNIFEKSNDDISLDLYINKNKQICYWPIDIAKRIFDISLKGQVSNDIF